MFPHFFVKSIGIYQPLQKNFVYWLEIDFQICLKYVNAT